MSLSRNEVENSGGVGIRLCGLATNQACVASGCSATASYNLVTKNGLKDYVGGNVIDYGEAKILITN